MDDNLRDECAEQCRWLLAYTVKIAAGANHSGFAVAPWECFADSPPGRPGCVLTVADFDTSRLEYINFGAEGLYRLPKWDLSHAQYVLLTGRGAPASLSQVQELESHHTRRNAGLYFWLSNCCHHNTQRQLTRLGYDASNARSVSWLDLTRVSWGKSTPG